MQDFQQIEWNAALAQECEQLVQLAQQEDLNTPGGCDLTSAALVEPNASGRAAIVPREPIVVAGLPVAAFVAKSYSSHLVFTQAVQDGSTVAPGQPIAEVVGPATALLAAERVMLNFLGRLCGIATQTRRYVEAVEGTAAQIYDTRKTTPGWRRLEKYAVRCGGGKNHRTGLYDAILIKDNHLAFGNLGKSHIRFTPATAVRRAREYLEGRDSNAIVEIEVDTLEQLEAVLPQRPDIVLLDNMSPESMQQAVAMRAKIAPDVQLDASGGITLDNLRAIAQTGVDRISIGALTHGARWVDVGLDWLD